MIINAQVKMLLLSSDKTEAYAVVDVDGTDYKIKVDVSGLVGKEIDRAARIAAIEEAVRGGGYDEQQ